MTARPSRASAAPFIARPRPLPSAPRRGRCWKPASRPSICWPPSSGGARPACSVGPAWARRCSSTSAFTTPPSTTRGTAWSAASASAPRRRRRRTGKRVRPGAGTRPPCSCDGRDRAPGVRFLVGKSALTMGEHFRDVLQQDVLLLMDNVFRFVQAGAEVSGLLGRMPSRVGYQPTLATELAALQERITSTAKGAITSVQAVYVPADDFTDPAAVHIFSHLSASVVLSRKRASEGLYPAVDPLASSSVMLTPAVVGQRHYDIARAVRRTLAEYEELRDIIAMLGLEELSSADRAVVARARRLERFLTQPFHVAEIFSGTPGQRVAIEETLAGCEAILERSRFDDSEMDYYMIGALSGAGAAA